MYSSTISKCSFLKSWDQLCTVFFPRELSFHEWLQELDPAVRAGILIHEREHVRRRDPLTAVVGLLLFSAMPWNPAVVW